MKTMDIANQKSAKKTPQFVCKSCDFKCSKQSDYDRHIETMKHKMLINANEKNEKFKSIYFYYEVR